MDSLEGIVERITFYSEETGYTVLRLRPSGRPRTAFAAGEDDLLTVVGNLPEVNPGESLRLEGAWASHPQYGKQFKAERCEQILPATVEGIKRYLGSGLIKGVGPKTAAKIVKKFGADTLTVVDEQPRKLREVLGIGAKKAAIIEVAWQQQKAIKNVMIFLQGHGVSTGLAVKIYKQYGDMAQEIVKSDPYRLARDIYGIGFKTADKIARQLGLPPNAPSRVEAGVAHALGELSDEGHVYSPVQRLTDTASELLAVPPDLIASAIERLLAEDRIKRETLRIAEIKGGGESKVREEEAVYLTPFYYGEIGVTNRLSNMMQSPSSHLADLRQRDLNELIAQTGQVELSVEQRMAIRRALENKVSVITGGPGTGKTTALKTLIGVLEATKHSYALASPTGRAAKRLSEATGRAAKTIHRMLGFQPGIGFNYNEEKPLPVHMLIVDEASMIDLLLMNNLLKALDPATHLLLVGDVDQLPSVGAGDVLRDVIDSNTAAVTRLSIIFRQAQGSLIITNAHRINRGENPIVPDSRGESETRPYHADFFLFVVEDPEEAANWVVDIVQNRIPSKFGLRAIDDVQVLSPMYRGAVGVANLNARLQEALNPASAKKAERKIGGRIFRAGDKLMATRNNYDKDTFNGDIGRLTAIDFEEQTLTINFEGREVSYDWLEADELAHAFAVSVHKSQGSEYPAVVLPMLTQHYMMLQRNLLYTAVTRAKKLCVLVGTRKAIAMAVKNATVATRYSGLDVRLREK
ncbi:MAG: ATP-dependent RecD-like DNA helicase [Chloroflexi bacterium]|nr:ATP-dependent RecD-like DNA helicase [Chloroflexota bacterium]